jgi:hypothetical protein
MLLGVFAATVVRIEEHCRRRPSAFSSADTVDAVASNRLDAARRSTWAKRRAPTLISRIALGRRAIGAAWHPPSARDRREAAYCDDS